MFLGKWVEIIVESMGGVWGKRSPEAAIVLALEAEMLERFVWVVKRTYFLIDTQILSCHERIFILIKK